jgi:lipopolysaccharide assembly outer membrane protein LptD (OstA)
MHTPQEVDTTQQESAKLTQRTTRRERQQSRKQESQQDSVRVITADTLIINPDSILAGVTDTVARRQRTSGTGLNAIISGKAKDSLHYDLRNNRVHLYEQGEVTYDDMQLKADLMNIDLDNKEIYAFGKIDSTNNEPVITRPTFIQGGTTLNMDTIKYNIETQRAKIKNIATQQGDGWLVGRAVKRMEDNTINIGDGMYTTCDQTDSPHFYYWMSKAKVKTGKNG